MESKHVDEWWDKDWQTVAKELLNVNDAGARNAVHFPLFVQARLGQEMRDTAKATRRLAFVTALMALATVALAVAAFLAL